VTDTVGCVLCGRPAVTRRIDLTDSDVSTRDIHEYEVRSVLRGLLICSACIVEQPIGRLLAVRGGVELVRGCVVQCAYVPPWYLKYSLPGGPRVWRKAVCPCCQGRATVQIIADAVDKPESALRRGIRDAFALLSLRRPDEDDYDEDDTETGHASEPEGIIIGGGSDDD
jgi:hypothetical protein